MFIDPELKDAKILIVDDQPTNVKLLERVLQVAGFRQMMGVTDPREGIVCYEKERPDLVLLDIRMPHMSGFEVMARLQEIEHSRYIPVLVLTAQTDKETRLQALESGARDFVSKPFDHVEVLSRIRNLLEVRLLHKQVLEQNRLLEERVKNRTQELHNTRLDIIRRLGRASEYRDNETGMHILRMSHYTMLVGRNMGLPADFVEVLLHASPMHDLGKIGIPDQILRKPGKLDLQEWEEMKKHALIGAELLSKGDPILLESARIISLTHHERWDGNGYPAGLQHEDIPLSGRIVAIADVFDALTSDRPYKKAWTVADAIQEMNQQSGIHFDPGILPYFLQSLPEILEIKLKFADPKV